MEQRSIGSEEHRVEFTPGKLQREVFHGVYASFLSFCYLFVVIVRLIDNVGRQECW